MFFFLFLLVGKLIACCRPFVCRAMSKRGRSDYESGLQLCTCALSEHCTLCSDSIWGKRYFAVEDRSQARDGDHVGGIAVEAGRTVSRRGLHHSGGWYLTCCGAKEIGIDPFTRLHFTNSSCTRGKTGMFHPGTLKACGGGGSRRHGGGAEGGGVKWTCCDTRLYRHSPRQRRRVHTSRCSASSGRRRPGRLSVTRR